MCCSHLKDSSKHWNLITLRHSFNSISPARGATVNKRRKRNICILFPLPFSHERKSERRDYHVKFTWILKRRYGRSEVQRRCLFIQRNDDIISLKILWFCCSLCTIKGGLFGIYGPERGSLCLSGESEQRFSTKWRSNKEKGENELLCSAEIC